MSTKYLTFVPETVTNMDGQAVHVDVTQVKKECKACTLTHRRTMVRVKFGCLNNAEFLLTVAQARALAGSLNNAAVYIGCDEVVGP